MARRPKVRRVHDAHAVHVMRSEGLICAACVQVVGSYPSRQASVRQHCIAHLPTMIALSHKFKFLLLDFRDIHVKEQGGDFISGGCGTVICHATSACRCSVSLLMHKEYIHCRISCRYLTVTGEVLQQPGGKYGGNYAEGLGFKSCLHLFLTPIKPVCTRMYAYKLVHTRMYCDEIVTE